MPTQVILLEKVDHLGAMGEVVSVKPGYARNYLLPQSKALRATKANIAYFDAQKSALEKVNNEKKAAAEKSAKKIEGVKVAIIRQASEGGQLYGSVNARDIADAITATTGENVQRNQVVMNTAYKTLGLFPVTISLHAEVKIEAILNIARSEDEAAIQEKTGKALVAESASEPVVAPANDARADLMDEEAFKAEQDREAEEAQSAAEDAAAAEEKSAKRAAKKAEAEVDADPADPFAEDIAEEE